jgi:THO complex subunit 2
VDRYDSETKALTALVRQETERRGAPSRAGEQAREALAGLKTEFKAQTLSHSATQRRLAIEKDHWFRECLLSCSCVRELSDRFVPTANAASSTDRAQIVYQLLQYCIIPRALLSPTDAIFAGRFIRTMHANGARNFSSLTAYDKVSLRP